MRFLPLNLDALLVELDDLPQTLALLQSLQSDPIRGVVELVPAARTVLVRHRPSAVTQAELVRQIGGRRLATGERAAGTLIEIPVRYDGEDLAEVAAMLGISSAEVIARHTSTDYTVAFTGFAPGFAYLSGGHPSLDVPRRQTPRTRIPAGAVGLAGRFSGVYPQASPGGWQILGVTDLPMWDLAREVPALLQPGFRVRFVDAAVRPAAALPEASRRRKVTVEADELAPAAATLEIVASGPQALFQDLGRPGLAAQGVSASGAMDPAALRAANRLVGNPADAACVEIAYGGFECVCQGDAVVAVTGAEVPIERVSPAGSRSWLPACEATALSDGDRLRWHEPRAGIRSYLAVRGGYAVAPVLGSRSTDTLARIGPAPIAVGDRLGILASALGGIVGSAEAQPFDLPRAAEVVTLDVVLGPRTDWFTPDAAALFARQEWHVTPQSNRVGLRLAGEQALARATQAELPSEGTVLGAIQVPASGQPVLFLADHPLTGGYPVIGAVAPHHLSRAGQVPIGARLRFNPIRSFEPLRTPDPRDPTP